MKCKDKTWEDAFEMKGFACGPPQNHIEAPKSKTEIGGRVVANCIDGEK